MAFPGGEDNEAEEVFEAEEQLTLDGGDDDDLPWLEDDEFYADEGGFDMRMIWFALIGFIAVGGVLLAVWSFTRDAPDPELAADGSTIEAPDGPYKQLPEDPGGREVAGTGDTAFEVAEGQSQRGILAEEPRPSIDRNQGEDPGTDDESPVPANAAYVQIGAFSTRAEADQAWASATGRYTALSGLRHRVVEGEVNGATVYRLQAIAADRASGEATCRAVRNSGGDCYVR